LHYEPNVPVFRTFSADTGQWTTFEPRGCRRGGGWNVRAA
jgi:hypothetical protein